MSKVLKIQPCLHRVVELAAEAAGVEPGIRCPSWRPLEPWQEESVATVREEFAMLNAAPEKSAIVAQVNVVLNVAVRRHVPTVWLFRIRRPIALIFYLWNAVAEVPYQRTLDGKLLDNDFQKLTAAAGRIGGAPLSICESPKTDFMLEVLQTMISRHSRCFAICDWTLSGEELAVARQISRESGLRFLFLR